jgi:hypothetical protein
VLVWVPLVCERLIVVLVEELQKHGHSLPASGIEQSKLGQKGAVSTQMELDVLVAVSELAEVNVVGVAEKVVNVVLEVPVIGHEQGHDFCASSIEQSTPSEQYGGSQPDVLKVVVVIVVVHVHGHSNLFEEMSQSIIWQ